MILPKPTKVHTKSVSVPIDDMGMIKAEHLFWAQDRLIKEFSLTDKIVPTDPRSNIAVMFHHEPQLGAAIIEAKMYTTSEEL